MNEARYRIAAIWARTVPRPIGLYAALLLALEGGLACDRVVATTAAPQTANTSASLADNPPIVDPVMGELSQLARHIIGALRDSVTRRSLARALKDSVNIRSGVSMKECASSSLSKMMLEEGERRGLGRAASMCALISARHGVILYMAPERLSRWDGTEMPVVTAISNPSAGIPDRLTAYRSTSKSVEISTAKSEAGPLLVILPFTRVRPGDASASTPKVRTFVVKGTDSPLPPTRDKVSP